MYVRAIISALVGFGTVLILLIVVVSLAGIFYLLDNFWASEYA
jgi:hypothetical protein